MKLQKTWRTFERLDLLVPGRIFKFKHNGKKLSLKAVKQGYKNRPFMVIENVLVQEIKLI